MNNEDINTYLPSILNPRKIKIFNQDISLTQNSTFSRSSLTLKRNNSTINGKYNTNQAFILDKENLRNKINCCPIDVHNVGKQKNTEISDADSLGFSAIDDINSIKNDVSTLSCFPLKLDNPKKIKDNNISILSISSITELDEEKSICSNNTVIYDVQAKPVVSLSFCVSNCDNVDVSTKKSNIKKIIVAKNKTDINVDCEILEGSELSEDNVNSSVNMNASLFNTLKRKAVAVNLEIKKQKLTGTEEKTENRKILILNTNAIEKLTHIIVQPPNYILVKRKFNYNDNYINSPQKPAYVSVIKHGKHVKNELLKQQSIDTYLKRNNTSKAPVLPVNGSKSLDNNVRASVCQAKELRRDDAQEMNRNSVVDTIGRTSHKPCPEQSRSPRISLPQSPSPKREVKSSISEAPRASSSRSKKESVGSLSPRRHLDSTHFAFPVKSKSNKTSAVGRIIPHHKIVTGTHFAVDAFSYGEIPNVKHYFLTHFHSDHYMGLNRNFNKMLFCSKITADLCVLRLGVSFKRVHIINLDETIVLDGVEVTAVDANHCPGALMFVFTLPNGKSILHTGDFRASDIMESYPVFWNKDVHTIYLDTTYCNPRYDFPKQDQSLEMALNLLREKKSALEKVGKKFSSVLIVCGTYTIGKEKFFHAMARRVGCSVWACPEKDLVLQTVEGRSFSLATPQSCQLHVVPMRDLTHEKMRSYLTNLKGAFSEVVAFKPSGWENGKNPSVEKDCVTIHGIPYSEHSSFSELIRFVKFLKPKQVIPTVYISGGIQAVQKYFPCPLISKEDIHCQSKLTDYFTIQNPQQVPAVT